MSRVPHGLAGRVDPANQPELSNHDEISPTSCSSELLFAADAFEWFCCFVGPCCQLFGRFETDQTTDKDAVKYRKCVGVQK